MIIWGNYIKAFEILLKEVDVKYHYRGLNIKIKGDIAVLTVTNGHFLFSAKFNSFHEIQDGNYTIPAELIEGFDKNFGVNIQILGNDVKITQGDNIKEGKLLAMRFPDYSRAIPSSLSGEISQFDIKYLSLFTKVRKLLTKDKLNYLHIHHNGRDACIIDIFVEDTLCVLMSLRELTNKTYFKPEWI